VGERKLAEGKVEIKARSGSAAADVPVDGAVDFLMGKITAPK
jgi:hypothetical protein